MNVSYRNHLNFSVPCTREGSKAPGEASLELSCPEATVGRITSGLDGELQFSTPSNTPSAHSKEGGKSKVNAADDQWRCFVMGRSSIF